MDRVAGDVRNFHTRGTGFETWSGWLRSSRLIRVRLDSPHTSNKSGSHRRVLRVRITALTHQTSRGHIVEFSVCVVTALTHQTSRGHIVEFSVSGEVYITVWINYRR